MVAIVKGDEALFRSMSEGYDHWQPIWRDCDAIFQI
jgi:hypothetical protein